jgi:hypothetical protein
VMLNASSVVRWALPSTAATTVYTASTVFDVQPSLSILSPIAGARLNEHGSK